jgi:hypothetical protein
MVSVVQEFTIMVYHVGNHSRSLRAAPRHSLARLRCSITAVAAAKQRLRLDSGAHGAVCEWLETSKWLDLIQKKKWCLDTVAIHWNTFMQCHRTVGHQTRIAECMKPSTLEAQATAHGDRWYGARPAPSNPRLLIRDDVAERSRGALPACRSSHQPSVLH